MEQEHGTANDDRTLQRTMAVRTARGEGEIGSTP
jgi:hypothetical protein